MLRTITTKYVLTADEIMEILVDRLDIDFTLAGRQITFVDVCGDSFTLDHVEITTEEKG